MIKFDEPINREQLEEFATQVEHLPSSLKEDLEKSFNLDQSPGFYTGLLSAYATSYVIVKNSFPGSQEEQTLGSLVAFLSDKVLKNEWYI